MEIIKEELYQWIRNLAVFYILLSLAVHLVPDEKYEKYIRFFMGLLLIFMIGTPVFSLIGQGGDLEVSFRNHFAMENRLREQEEFHRLHELYLEKGYELEIEKRVRAALERRAVYPAAVKAEIRGEKIRVYLYLKKKPPVWAERRIKDGLLEDCEIREGEYEIKMLESGDGTVDHSSASGTSPGSGFSSSIP